MAVVSWAEDRLLQQISPNSFWSSEKRYFSPECIWERSFAKIQN